MISVDAQVAIFKPLSWLAKIRLGRLDRDAMAEFSKTSQLMSSFEHMVLKPSKERYGHSG